MDLGRLIIDTTGIFPAEIPAVYCDEMGSDLFRSDEKNF